MTLDGGCFCGAMRYRFEGEPIYKGQCHCRQCQYFAGGGPNIFMAIPIRGFSYAKGKPATYSRPNAPTFGATREFCPTCGTHLVTRPEPWPDVAILKVGTLDEPALYGGPQVAIFACDKQPFHLVADGLPTYDKMAPR